MLLASILGPGNLPGDRAGSPVSSDGISTAIINLSKFVQVIHRGKDWCIAGLLQWSVFVVFGTISTTWLSSSKVSTIHNQQNVKSVPIWIRGFVLLLLLLYIHHAKSMGLFRGRGEPHAAAASAFFFFSSPRCTRMYSAVTCLSLLARSHHQPLRFPYAQGERGSGKGSRFLRLCTK